MTSTLSDEWQILDDFKAFLRAISKKESSIKEYYYVVREFIGVVGAKKKYTEKDIMDFLIYKSKKKKERGYKGKMRGSYLRFAIYAVKAFYRSMNIEWKFKKENMPKREPPLRRFYTIDEIYKLLDAMKDEPRHWLAFKILGLAFSRRASIPALQRESYNPKEGKIIMPSIKGGRTPVIILDRETKVILDDYLSKRTDPYLALIPSLRPRNPDGHWNPTSLNDLLVGYCKKAKVQNKGMHAWRRGIVTYLYNVKKMRELEIWAMGDWISKSMVSEYIQLGQTDVEMMRTKRHPFYKRRVIK